MADIIMDDEVIEDVVEIKIEAADRERYISFRSKETVQETKTLTITKPETTTVLPDSGYDSIEKITVDVQIPIYAGE